MAAQSLLVVQQASILTGTRKYDTDQEEYSCFLYTSCTKMNKYPVASIASPNQTKSNQSPVSPSFGVALPYRIVFHNQTHTKPFLTIPFHVNLSLPLNNHSH